MHWQILLIETERAGLSSAMIHEWLTFYAGSEKVVEQVIPVLKPKKLFTLVDHMTQDRPAVLNDLEIETSFIQRLPFSKKKYRGYLPLMPLAIEQLDVSEFDLIFSSHHCVTHGVITRPDQPHLVYTHSPMRYAWDLQHQYLSESGINRKRIRGAMARSILHYLRIWDRAAGQRPDFYAANSQFIADRIWKYYRRDACVIHPPVDVDLFSLNDKPREDYYVTASRMVPYKKISLIVRAFSRTPHRKLIVIGDGPEFEQTRNQAGKNVTFLGYQPNDVLKQHLSSARAFVFAAQEDFGILPVEAQACGTPVIALGKGGTAETVMDGETGVLFDTQSEESLLSAVDRFESISSNISAERVRANAERFSRDRFQREILKYIDHSLDVFRSRTQRS